MHARESAPRMRWRATRVDVIHVQLLVAAPSTAHLVGEVRLPPDNDVDHAIPLAETGWGVWRDAVLRAAGFPADGVLRLAAVDAAAAVDAYLEAARTAPGARPDRGARADAALVALQAAAAAAVAAAVAESRRVIDEIAGDPLFREAVTWQNLNALVALDGIRRSGPDGRDNNRRRLREHLIARYWQRYCAKNDTIGFFGPVCWTTFADNGPPLRLHAGPGLLRRRTVAFEWRALTAFGACLAADPAVRPWLPAGLHRHFYLDG